MDGWTLRGPRGPGLPGTGPLLLEIDLTVPPADPPAGDPLARLGARGRPQRGPLLRALHEAGSDRRVVGLVAKVGGALPWALAQELRLGVAAFAASGKPTVAWAESFGQGSSDLPAYVLASAFDELWLQPSGDLNLLGVALETTFLRGALDKLGVEPELEGRYEYKNAVDRITRTELTPAHRESLERLGGSLLDEAVRAVAAGRGLAAEEVRSLVDTGPRTADEARRVGLVDRLGYRDEVYAVGAGAGGGARVAALRRPLASAPAAVPAVPARSPARPRRPRRGARRHRHRDLPSRPDGTFRRQRHGDGRPAGRPRRRRGPRAGPARRLARRVVGGLGHDLARGRAGSATRASRSWCRWARTRRPAATTSPARPT